MEDTKNWTRPWPWSPGTYDVELRDGRRLEGVEWFALEPEIAVGVFHWFEPSPSDVDESVAFAPFAEEWREGDKCIAAAHPHLVTAWRGPLEADPDARWTFAWPILSGRYDFKCCSCSKIHAFGMEPGEMLANAWKVLVWRPAQPVADVQVPDGIPPLPLWEISAEERQDRGRMLAREVAEMRSTMRDALYIAERFRRSTSGKGIDVDLATVTETARRLAEAFGPEEGPVAAQILVGWISGREEFAYMDDVAKGAMS